MDDTDYIEKTIKAREQSVGYFSAQNKPERERWVVETLLLNMNISYVADDIASPENDPPDVVALEAEFEVKEILDPDRKRHRDYKDALDRAKKATQPKDLFTGFTPVDSSVEEIYKLCLTATENLQDKYPAPVRSALDLLFYVNLERVFGVQEEPFPDVSELATLGWRSVTFIKGDIACCFYASKEAPTWLREKVTQVFHRALE